MSSTNHYYYLSSSSSSTTSSSSSTSTKTSDAIDKSAESWKLPYSIEDEDLTFDGKPLNLLYEENRHHVMDERREHSSRGRSRTSKKRSERDQMRIS